jgi:iron complex transport system substrate-binding protein
MKTKTAALLTIALFCMLPPGANAGSVEPSQAAAERIVSLAPNLTEIICAVGGADSLVGRTTACDYPPSIVSNVPAVGGFGAPSLELLVSFRPSLVLYVDLEDKNLTHKMDSVGLTYTQIQCRALADIPGAVMAVGRCVHREAAASELAARLTAGIAAFRSNPATNAPLVFIEIWNDPLMTAGRTSFVAELVRLAGGRNIGDDIEKDYAEVSSEWVLARKPDVVLCLGTPAKGAARQVVLGRAGWGNVPAVRNGRVYDRLSTDVMTRPGPRVLDGIEELRACIANERKAK